MPVIAFYNLDLRTLPLESLMSDVLALVQKNANYRKMDELALQYRETGVEVNFTIKKGVEVQPAGFKPLRIRTGQIEIDADYDSFVVRDKVDQNNLPTCIPAIKGGKRSIPVFYRMVKDNERALQNMSFSEVRKMMAKAGVLYHEYCAMD